MTTQMSNTSKWANRFVVAAIAQGALAAGLTAYFLYDSKYPQNAQDPGPARIVASGGAGTWLAMGYLGVCHVRTNCGGSDLALLPAH